jgi:DNA-binding transcriptional ArsR family regulator
MADVLAAVADGTRRRILERLRVEGPLTITSLSDDLPITRQAVTKHLRVLEAAGLVEGTARGRERVHSLSGAPLREVNDWLAPYEAAWDERLDRLKAHLEGDEDERGDDARREDRGPRV